MLTVVLLLCNVWTVQVQAEFMRGVNYGNRFLPEAWMNMREWQHDYRDSIFGPYYGSNVSAPNGVDRVSLCDVTEVAERHDPGGGLHQDEGVRGEAAEAAHRLLELGGSWGQDA